MSHNLITMKQQLLFALIQQNRNIWLCNTRTLQKYWLRKTTTGNQAHAMLNNEPVVIQSSSLYTLTPHCLN